MYVQTALQFLIGTSLSDRSSLFFPSCFLHTNQVALIGRVEVFGMSGLDCSRLDFNGTIGHQVKPSIDQVFRFDGLPSTSKIAVAGMSHLEALNPGLLLHLKIR